MQARAQESPWAGVQAEAALAAKFARLQACRLCPRGCGVDRLSGRLGFCRMGTGTEKDMGVAAISLHAGEEPVLSGKTGVCNVFFGHCNLQCLYCQNADISRNTAEMRPLSLDTAADRIARILDTGVRRLGFVSPSHMVPQMLALIDVLARRGHKPLIVYNSGGYDSVETLKELEGVVDMYLPDCKYMESELAGALSGARDYPEKARGTLKEMYRQMGAVLHLDEDGLAERGLIVRHLVLPGQMANSLAVLRFLASELSPKITLSLMAQYGPTPAVATHPHLNRRITAEEYSTVLAEMERLGFTHGFVQELESAECYWPDFSRDDPFSASATKK